MTRPVLNCCHPVGPMNSPSGPAYYHAKDCPVARNEKVRPFPKRQTEHLRLVQRGEDSRASVPTAAHPSGKGSWGEAVDTWLKHPSDCDCWPCAYVSEHADDAERWTRP